MDKLAEIKKKIEEIQAKSAVSTEIRAFIELVLNVIKKSKDELTKLSEENIQVIRESIAYIEKNHENTLGVIKEEKDAMVGEFNANLTSVKQLLEEVKAIEVKNGEDGKDGEDADPEEIIPLVLERLPKPVEETGETIANKLESLKGDERLDASAIKNLPEIKGGKFYGGSGIKEIVAGSNVTVDNSNPGYPVVSSTGGGGSGTVDSVVAGTGISVNNTDPANPIVTNSAPDQTVAITAGTNITSVTGTYPNFTINAATQTTDISGLVPYTGATGDVTLGTHALTVHNIKPDASDGLLLESNNGTDIGLLGAGNTANVTWYGSHNFDTATQDTIAAFTGAGKTLGSLATATYPSLTELSYVKGVTSAIQTQLNAKGVGDALTSGALTQFVGNNNWKVWYSDGSGDVKELALGADGTFLKSNGAAVAPSFATPAGSGDVSKVGTPVNNQIGVWTGDGTIEGDANLTFDTTTDTLGTVAITMTGTGTLGAVNLTNGNYDFIIGSSVGGNATFRFLPYSNDIYFDNTSTTGDSIFRNNTVEALRLKNDLTAVFAGAVTAPTFNVGNADTTLSRVSAGVVAIEGVNILTTATGLPLSGGTMTGNITLGENTSIALDPAGSADGKWTGTTIAATAGYAQTFGDLVYLDPTDSRWEKADANSASGADGDARGILGMVVVAGASDGSACTILLNGVIRADAAFPAFTINNPIYVSETAGAVTQTQPTTTDVVIRVVGSALTADEMYFNPDRIWFTHV